MPKKDKEYIETDANNILEEFLDVLEKNRGINVTKLASKLDKDRNFMSGFLHACLALKLCEIDVIGNSLVCHSTDIGIKYQKKEEIVLKISR